MSEVALFSGLNSKPPAFLKNKKSVLSDITFSGFSGKTISIRGGVWRMMVDGKEVSKPRAGALEVVIVNMSPNVGRKFYEGSYETGDESAPVCWSADGISPSDLSSSKQSSKCETCPKNIKGSGATSDAKACKYFRHLAIVLADKVEGDVYKLTLPAMSLFGESTPEAMSLDGYRKLLKAKNVAFDEVVTQMDFDHNASVPKVVFCPVRYLEEHEFKIGQEQALKEETVDAVTISYSAKQGLSKESPASLPSKAEQFEQLTPPPKKTVQKPIPQVQDVDDIPEPTVHQRKAAPVQQPTNDLDSILSGEWGDIDD